jgi:hypothetical protein
MRGSTVAPTSSPTSRTPPSARSRKRDPFGYEGSRYVNPQPRIILEIADCSNRINLEFELDSELDVENSLHKADVLATPLAKFRTGLVGGARLCREDEPEVERLNRDVPQRPPTRRLQSFWGRNEFRRDGRGKFERLVSLSYVTSTSNGSRSSASSSGSASASTGRRSGTSASSASISRASPPCATTSKTCSSD